MAEIKLGEFGLSLTGRPYGKDCFEKLSRRDLNPPFVFDFKDVISLGSSFGEEVIVPFATRAPGAPIKITSANSSIKDCLEKISTDFKISLEFKD